MNISNEQLFEINETADQINTRIERHHNQHLHLLRDMLAAPLKYYFEFVSRFNSHGLNAPFPELEDVINYLIDNLKLKLLTLDEPILKNVAYLKLINLFNISYRAKQQPYPYGETIRTIADSLEFFDIYERQYNGEELGVYYHALNYRYYLNNLLDIKTITQFIFFPTIYKNLGATDIINLRPVPIFFCGASLVKMYVDEFWQSPLEFFMHDMNHSRRMGKNMSADSETMQVSLTFRDELTALTQINKNDCADVTAMKQLMRMLIFEIVHEDALYLLPEVVWNALHRGEDYVYVFERTFINAENKLDARDYPINVEGALAYTKYKLQHKFYDDGTKEWLVKTKYRYANYLVFAAMILLVFIKSKYPKFKDKAIKDYSYYLNRASSNFLIPRPVHDFKVGDDENGSNIDITSLKTGLPQNSWKDGYRRVVGEHLQITTDEKLMSSEIDSPKYMASQTAFDCAAHKVDFELFKLIFQKFRQQNAALTNAQIDMIDSERGGYIDVRWLF